MVKNKNQERGGKIKIHYNKPLLLIIIILIIFLIILVYFIVKNQKNTPDDYDNITIGECEKDSDCVKVQTGCCPCSMGGIEKCMHVSELGKYTDLLKKCDARIMCTAMYACNIESCVCINKKCQALFI